MATIALRDVPALLRRKHQEIRRRLQPVRQPSQIESEDVQGLVFRGYGGLPHCRYVLLQVRDAAEARHWLAALVERISRGTPASREQAIHLAFTYRGLLALGLPAKTAQGFSAEFIAGMVGPHRSRFLGDVGESDPKHWSWGGPNNPALHALLILYAPSEAKLRALYEAEREAWSREGLVDVHTLHTSPLSEREHFGFVDGISQPAIEGYHKAPSGLHLVRAGEFVLGYPNEYGLYTARPLVDSSVPAAAAHLPSDIAGSTQRDFGRNGTYLVMRQLRQDVVAFRATLERLTQNPDGSSNPEEKARLAAQMVGRWPSGAPLITSPWQDDAGKAKDNEFRYHHEDPEGLLCPIGAHVRRANPRDALAPEPGTEKSLAVNRRHRILRRGRLYGSELPEGAVDDAERGLIFVALNANIVRQFEFIQHSWLMDPRFNGLYGASDPITGGLDDNAFSAPGNPLRARCTGLPRFVSVAGGAYFFMPGIRALRFLSELSPSSQES